MKIPLRKCILVIRLVAFFILSEKIRKIYHFRNFFYFSEFFDEISVFQNFVLTSENFRKFRRFSEDFRDPMGPKCGRISITGWRAYNFSYCFGQITSEVEEVKQLRELEVKSGSYESWCNGTSLNYCLVEGAPINFVKISLL